MRWNERFPFEILLVEFLPDLARKWNIIELFDRWCLLRWFPCAT
jgi:hypothetical protein